MDDRPLILSARFDSTLLAQLDRYRMQYFPPTRNFLLAHVTLFHHLPGLQLDQIRQELSVGEKTESLVCSVRSVRFTGRGTHAVLDCEPLRAIRNELATRWRAWLTPQDNQRFGPHVTIQNKVDPAEARRAFAEIQRGWVPLSGQIIGLDLWHYAGGPWELAGQFPLPRTL